jgi:hypothetical protein
MSKSLNVQQTVSKWPNGNLGDERKNWNVSGGSVISIKLRMFDDPIFGYIHLQSILVLTLLPFPVVLFWTHGKQMYNSRNKMSQSYKRKFSLKINIYGIPWQSGLSSL